MRPQLSRRQWFAALTVIVAPSTATARTGLHVSGQLVSDASDLQDGYYALCGTGTGACKADDAIGISVHPKNKLYADPLRAMVGQTVHVSIFT